VIPARALAASGTTSSASESAPSSAVTIGHDGSGLHDGAGRC
jgi:hypothetical protein